MSLVNGLLVGMPVCSKRQFSTREWVISGYASLYASLVNGRGPLSQSVLLFPLTRKKNRWHPQILLQSFFYFFEKDTSAKLILHSAKVGKKLI